MRSITKNPEPRSLAQHRCTPHAKYDNYADKNVLRQSLVAEQRGICCYCMSRIRPAPGHMKIAHWHAQATHPLEQLDYHNLLGACLGNQGQPRRSQHCDTRQGDSDVSRNPANPAHRVEDLVRYQPDGRVVSADGQFDRDLNDVLNLNVAFLKNNRKAALDGFRETIEKRGQLPRATLERWVRRLEWTIRWRRSPTVLSGGGPLAPEAISSRVGCCSTRRLTEAQ